MYVINITNTSEYITFLHMESNGSELGQMRFSYSEKQFFWVCLYVFVEIANNYSLQQCVTSSRGTTYVWNFGGKILG